MASQVLDSAYISNQMLKMSFTLVAINLFLIPILSLPTEIINAILRIGFQNLYTNNFNGSLLFFLTLIVRYWTTQEVKISHLVESRNTLHLQ